MRITNNDNGEQGLIQSEKLKNKKKLSTVLILPSQNQNIARIPKKFQKSSQKVPKKVPKKFQKSSKKVPKKFQKSFKKVPKSSKKVKKKVWKKLKKGPKKVPKKFQISSKKYQSRLKFQFKKKQRCGVQKKRHGHNFQNFGSKSNQRGTNPYSSTLIRFGAKILKIVAVSFFFNTS